MSFLKKLFGSQETQEEGFFVYVRCDRCGSKVRLRIHKEYDLIRNVQGYGYDYEPLEIREGMIVSYDWHKTIVDSKCFQRIPVVAHFDGRFNLENADIQGGCFITKEEYEAEEVSQTTDADDLAE